MAAAAANNNAFGGFLHTSPLSNLTSSTSHPPDPKAALASNCIRDYFGPLVQTVADALHSRGPSTMSDLIATIRHRCLRDWNEERGRLVDRLNASVVVGANNNKFNKGIIATTSSSNNNNESYYHGGKVTMNKARGAESAGYVTESSHIRAALIVLLHHSLVKVSGGTSGGGGSVGAGDGKHKHPSSSSRHAAKPQHHHYTYTFLHERARLLLRYPRYVEHARDVMNDTAAQIVECLLISGRMRGEDVVQSAWECQKRKMHNILDGEEDVDDYDNKVLTEVVQSFERLVEAGYVEMVRPIVTNKDLEHKGRMQNEENEDDMFGNEFEFSLNEDGSIFNDRSKATRKRSALSSDQGVNTKKQKIDGNALDDHHPQILSLLSTKRNLIPHGSVYRVSTAMFHASLRVDVLSRLVSEIYPDERHVGAIVKAALTYAARQEHGPMRGVDESEEARHSRMAEWGIFSPPDIVPFLPLDVTKSLRSQVGGLNQNLSTLLVQMSKLQYPTSILLEIEEAQGHPMGGKFEVCTRQLLQRMLDRIQHRFLTTHRGLVAARIVSVLQMKGHCESDAIAEDAMVPTKEAREVLHRLHRDSYIDLADMHVTKTHNTGTAIFLWDVIPSRLFKTVINNTCTALLNLRLRRQHEVEVGRDWMNRAKDAGSAEENVHEGDKKKYHAFCKGLERLDCACLQLDETLMVLKDF
ncbi:hypothetical protein ACHAWU_006799 [Discostella pseudostelligera]|uniref:DNA-directed RNA polymerase III subunit RPC3 n=1 Tax=Discostella pseudostelligera TaxID=259834 RepID=A0ABD3N0B1_9STRA